MNKKNTILDIGKTGKYILFICLSYGFTGINLIIFSVVEGLHSKFFTHSVVIAVIMLCMIPVSLLDNRKEMRGKLNAIMCGVIHFVMSICISCIHSFWLFMVLYVLEFVVSLIANHIANK